MKKQAVVLIHGIGEQVPMQTLRGFVRAVWTEDAAVHNPHSKGGTNVWSKPDGISLDLELRRLTTASNREGKRADFFEFYWAHMMEDTTLSHVGAWLKVLLLRWPSRVPDQLRGIWLTLWVLAIATGLAFAQYKANIFNTTHPISGWWVALGVALWGIVAWALVRIAGDAARYLHVAPSNIASRKNIRTAGIRLLQRLHECGQYDRIVVVGHSLGTVIGYDLLTHLWAEYHDGHSKSGAAPLYAALDDLQAKANATSFNVDEYQASQAEYLKELQKQGNGWLISDFVTMGSPLAHAGVLMARNEEEFARKKGDREFPTCPPTNESVGELMQFWFEDGKTKMRIPHHGAVFGPTRWTNLYFPCHLTIFGDVIGGPVADEAGFGRGIRDTAVRTSINGGLLSHTRYWDLPEDFKTNLPENIKELRKTLKICKAEA